MEPLSEELLIARSGERSAFGKLVLRHRERIMGLVYAMTNSETAAEDLPQETFIRAYVSRRRFWRDSSL